ncbi:MAG: bacterial Ig-like domain-containing protein [Oscillospiraceae bacterium]|nr:bacterial Ig-like domain-containing protein [Oscillospiraceae bacterium]
MKKQHLSTAVTSAVCLLACAVSAAAAVSAQESSAPADPAVTAYTTTCEGSCYYEDENIFDFRIDRLPDKTVYRIGETPDFTGGLFSCRSNGLTLDKAKITDYPDLVDASEFDSTKPGEYMIRISNGGVYTCFPVTVTNEAVTTAAPSENKNDDYGGTAHEYMEYIRVFVVQPPDKVTYQIGEELDLTGALISGDGESNFDHEPLINHPEMVDASKFDNTKPGTYEIVIRGKRDSTWLYVTVAEPGTDVTGTVTQETTGTTVTLCTCDQLKGPQGTVGDYGSPIILDQLPNKTVYQIGEELDLTGALISGGWVDRFDHEPLTNHLHLISYTDFDNTTPGEYTVYLEDFFTNGRFEVYVVDGDSSASVVTDNSETTWTELTTTTPPAPIVEGKINLVSPPDKGTYFVGEELDLTGATISGYGNVTFFSPEYRTLNYDWFNSKLTDCMSLVDASEFDNTTPGTYRIVIRDKYGLSTSFTVRVLPALTEDSGDVNGDKNVTVADAVLLARVAAEDTAVTITDEGKANGDIDNDNRLTLEDLTFVLKIIAKLI